MKTSYTSAEVVDLLSIAMLFCTQPWRVLGHTEEQWLDEMASHERGEEEDHFLDQNPEIDEALRVMRSKLEQGEK